MTVTGADVSSKLKDMLRERGYAVSEVGPRTWEARKKLKRVGLKGRIIYFLTRVVDTLTLKELEDINKLFERRRPKGSMTFFFYNIVLIVDDGYEEEVVKYIADKMFETWNTAPYTPWDVLFASYTKVTHTVSVAEGIALYPYKPQLVQKMLHREVIEVMNSLITWLKSHATSIEGLPM